MAIAVSRVHADVGWRLSHSFEVLKFPQDQVDVANDAARSWPQKAAALMPSDCTAIAITCSRHPLSHDEARRVLDLLISRLT